MEYRIGDLDEWGAVLVELFWKRSGRMMGERRVE